LENPGRKQSADFGNASNYLPMDKSIHGGNTPRPEMDQHGHSDESSEGIVADHKPFNGIQDAIENQDRLRNNVKRPDETNSESEEEQIRGGGGAARGGGGVGGGGGGVGGGGGQDGPPSARRRIKQVLYSDKSESSVDDMMEDTPSNYNIANGRLEGKSMGLKAILLYAKN
jgi:hypothetical protein